MNNHEIVSKMEAQLEEIDNEIVQITKTIKKVYPDWDLPLSLRKNFDGLTDLRKDYADLVQGMKSTIENSWEEMENGAGSLFIQLSDSIQKIKDELS